MRKATIAIEDRRFFKHGGVDVEGIARAAVADIKAGAIVEGGSTITQQLVRNLYISREQTVQRKVKEACLALEARRRVVEAADPDRRTSTRSTTATTRTASRQPRRRTSRSPPSELDLSESALLAGLTQAPSIYDPFTVPARALARRQEVLRAMLDTGVITPRIYRIDAQRRGRRFAPDGSTTGSASRTSSATSATSSSRCTARSRFAPAGSRSTRRSSRATRGLPRRRSATR